jgi:hypothetical protein
MSVTVTVNLRDYLERVRKEWRRALRRRRVIAPR